MRIDRHAPILGRSHALVAIAVILTILFGWLFPGQGKASSGWGPQTNPAGQVDPANQKFPAGLRGVSFSDPFHGVAVGDRSAIVRTDDSGATWSSATVDLTGSKVLDPRTLTLYGVAFPSHDVGYAVGGVATGGGSGTGSANELGVVLKTTDGGSHWTAQALPSDRSNNVIYGVGFSDGTHGAAVGESPLPQDVGNPQEALYTSDGGLTWHASSVPSVGVTGGVGAQFTTLAGVSFTDVSHGYAVGGILMRTKTAGVTYSGTIMKSADGGASWAPLAAAPQSLQPAPGTAPLQWIPGAAMTAIAVVSHASDCESTNTCKLVAVGEHGVILKTTNSGGSWNLEGGGVTAQNLNGVSFADGQHGFAVGDGGTVLATSDGGDTWTVARDAVNPSPPSADTTRAVPLRSVSFPASCAAYAVGDAGTIIHNQLSDCSEGGPSPTPTTSASPTPTPSATPSPTPSPTPSGSPSPTPSGSPTPSPSGSPSSSQTCDSTSPKAEVTPPDGTVSRLMVSGDGKTEPVRVGVCTADNPLGHETGFLADTVNRRLIEAGANSQAPNGSVVLDADTYQVLSSMSGTAGCCYPAPATLCCVLNSAVDPIDPPSAAPDRRGLLITAGGVVTLATEVPLGQRLLSWSLPGPIPAEAQGFAGSTGENAAEVSWYGPADEAIVGSTQCSGSDQNCSVFVNAYSVRDSLAQGKGALIWRASVPGCKGLPLSVMGPHGPYRGEAEPAVFVPCMIQAAPGLSTHGESGERYAIVKMELGSTPGSGVVCNKNADDPVCPTGNATVGVAPGLFNDFFFDPTSERGFATQTNPAPINVLVYDGKRGEFESRANIATIEDGSGIEASVLAGIDPATGRFYTISQHAGMALFDGRRTPLQAPSLFPDYQITNGRLRTLPIFPPTSAHPYTRVFVPAEGDPTSLEVYADRLPVSVDPPPFGLDKLTYNGPITPGLIPSITYGADARGYGFHSDLVGGITGIWNSAEVAPGFASPGAHGGSLPFGPGNRDVVGAVVNALTLQDGAANGQASALHATDDVTRDDYKKCTGSPQDCAPPVPVCFFPGDNLPCVPDPNGPIDQLKQTYHDNNGPKLLQQEWPASDAVCDPSSTAPATSSGMYATTGYSADGKPQQTQLPGTDQGASASVHCDVPATGSAQLSTAPESVPVKVGESSVTSRISPNGLDDPPNICGPSVTVPGKGSGIVVATTTASAHHILVVIDGGTSGSGALSIGEVDQTAIAWAGGRAGTAHSCRQVTIKRVAVSNNGKWQDVCDDSCSSKGLDQLNTNFSTFAHIFTPQPDDLLFSGTPGGYTAVVAADRVQQSDDSQFNGMPTAEAAFLPGLRIELYNPQDGSPGLSREILDFAGVQVDAQQAVQVFPIGDTSGQSTPSTPGRPGTPAKPAVYIPGSVQTINQPVTGTELASAINASTSQGIAGSLPTLLKQFFERVFKGFGAIFRSPLQMLQMLAFLCVFCLPAVLVARRRLWLAEGGGRT